MTPRGLPGGLPRRWSCGSRAASEVCDRYGPWHAGGSVKRGHDAAAVPCNGEIRVPRLNRAQRRDHHVGDGSIELGVREEEPGQRNRPLAEWDATEVPLRDIPVGP